MNKSLIALLLFIVVGACQTPVDEDKVRSEILEHGSVIRQAFLDADVQKIETLHHPEVIKALGYNNLKTGRQEVIDDVASTLKNYKLEFVENDVEHILIAKDLAIEQTRFAIKGTPVEGGDSFVFKGRTMVTYVRYEESPTGWATIREIIQPEN